MREMDLYRRRLLENSMLDYLDANEESEQRKNIIRSFVIYKTYAEAAKKYGLKTSQVRCIIQSYTANTRHFMKFISWYKKNNLARNLSHYEKISIESKKVLLYLAECESVCKTSQDLEVTPAFVYRSVHRFIELHPFSFELLFQERFNPLMLQSYRYSKKLCLKEAADFLCIPTKTLMQYEEGLIYISNEAMQQLTIQYGYPREVLWDAYTYFNDRNPREITREDFQKFIETYGNV